MIELLDGPADNILAFSFSGQISDADFQAVIDPVCTDRIPTMHDPGLLLVFAADFKKFTTTAFWDHAWIGLHRAEPFARIAIVTDVDWITSAAAALNVPDRVRAFPAENLPQARDWLSD